MTCVLIPAGEPAEGATGVTYARGISADTAGATGLCVQLATFPPGARAKAHMHEGHESAAYVISGHVGMWFGERLEQHFVAGPGDFAYIPAGVPHLPYNASDTEPAIAVLSRTDPNENESVVPLPELDALVR